MTATTTGKIDLVELAAWAASVPAEDLSKEAEEMARRALLDVIGVAYAARDEPTADVLARYLDSCGGGGTSVALGLGRTTSPAEAAFVGGAMAHALDYDDSIDLLQGHPSATIYPAILSIISSPLVHNAASPLRGADLLSAYCVGVEVATAIGAAVNPAHGDAGWHPSATLGAFGTAAAVGRLIGLDGERMMTALALTASGASGVKGSFGTMAKPLQVGNAARIGLQAALLVLSGAQTGSEVFDGPSGFVRLHHGHLEESNPVRHLPSHRPDQITAWAVVSPGLRFKLHACCGHTHSAIDATLSIRDRGGRPAQVDRIDVWLDKRVVDQVDKPEVDSTLAAKFSVQHVVAAALVRGAAGISEFDEQTLSDETVADLRAKVRVQAFPDTLRGRRAARVDVSHAGGTDSATLSQPVARSRATGLTDSHLIDKFMRCTANQLEFREQQGLIDNVLGLDVQGPASSLFEWLAF